MTLYRKTVGIVAGLLLLGFGVSALAQEGVVQKVEITKFGIYQDGVVKPADPKVKGSVDEVEMKLIKQTSDIEAKVGVSYGIWYKASGKEGVEKATLLVRMPGKGLAMEGKMVNEVRLPLALKVGVESSYGFAIESPAEILPGEWIFEIWVRGAKMAQQNFTVR